MAYKIDLQTIEFKPRTNYRIARAVFKISTEMRESIEVPVEVFIANDGDDGDAIKFARAALHKLTSELAEQTKEWALQPGRPDRQE